MQPGHSTTKVYIKNKKLHEGGTISSRGTTGYFTLIIRRNWRDIMHNTIFLHAAAVAEVHLEIGRAHV